MSQVNLKITAIVCIAVTVICLFIAWERYEDNASKVRAANQFMQNGLLGGMMGGANFQPGMPSATKYALFFAILAGASGAICLVMAKSQAVQPPQNGVPRPPNDASSMG